MNHSKYWQTERFSSERCGLLTLSQHTEIIQPLLALLIKVCKETSLSGLNFKHLIIHYLQPCTCLWGCAPWVTDELLYFLCFKVTGPPHLPEGGWQSQLSTQPQTPRTTNLSCPRIQLKGGGWKVTFQTLWLYRCLHPSRSTWAMSLEDREGRKCKACERGGSEH